MSQASPLGSTILIALFTFCETHTFRVSVTAPSTFLASGSARYTSVLMRARSAMSAAPASQPAARQGTASNSAVRFDSGAVQEDGSS